MPVSTPRDLALTYATPLAMPQAPHPVPLPGAQPLDVFDGTPGNDSFKGTLGDDIFDMGDGGKDKVAGKNGNDVFNFGGALTAKDAVDGGDGNDTLSLSGDYSSGLIFGASTMRNVETIILGASNSYFLTLDNSNVVFGQALTVDGSALGASDVLILDGSAETSSTLTLIGGVGNDSLIGGGALDAIDASLGGDDTVIAGGGNDTITMGAAFTLADSIDGGVGFDTLSLSGDYSAGITLGGNLTSIERVALLTDNIYDLTLTALLAGQTLTIDASALTAAGSANIDIAAIDGEDVTLLGGAGDDAFTIGAEAVVEAGDGDDTITVVGTLAATARIDGGQGTDAVVLDGDYSAQLALLPTTLKGIETLTLTTGHSYNLALSDGTVGGGGALTVDASALAANNKLTFDASQEVSGTVTVTGGAGNDTFFDGGGDDMFEGGTNGDTFHLTLGGDDSFFGGNGNDVFFLGPTYDEGDTVDGGAGLDSAVIAGDDFLNAVLPLVEDITLMPGATYFLDANKHVADGVNIHFDGERLGVEDSIFFSGTGTGAFWNIAGGAAEDFLHGGESVDFFHGNGGDDRLDGRGGSDLLVGDAGHDTYVFHRAADSTGEFNDAIFANFDEDFIELKEFHHITGIDAHVTEGKLNQSGSQFDAQMTAALEGKLEAHHAVIFDPDSGTAEFDTYLIIDVNRVAGYQAGEDLVLNITVATGTLTVDNFI